MSGSHSWPDGIWVHSLHWGLSLLRPWGSLRCWGRWEVGHGAVGEGGAGFWFSANGRELLELVKAGNNRRGSGLTKELSSRDVVLESSLGHCYGSGWHLEAVTHGLRRSSHFKNGLCGHCNHKSDNWCFLRQKGAEWAVQNAGNINV